MKMLIQHVYGDKNGPRKQYEVYVQRFEVHEGVVLALHRPYGKYDTWVVSDLLTGGSIAVSISEKVAFARAKSLISKHKDKFQKRQIDELTKMKLRSLEINEERKLTNLYRRKCRKRELNYFLATTVRDIESVDILGDEKDSILLGGA